MNELAPTAPQWANRLRNLCDRTAEDTAPPSRAEAWQIVYFNLSRYLRYHSARLGRIDPDDIADIASQKTLELMHKVDMSLGPLVELPAERISGFLSTVARNGLITFLKKAGRTVTESGGDELTGAMRAESSDGGPAALLESREYARALCACVQVLEERARTLWFFRVCYDMSSRDIAGHPRVKMSPSHVDVALHRVRQAVRNCMRKNGYETDRMPPGTFAALWQVLHRTDGSRLEAM